MPALEIIVEQDRAELGRVVVPVRGLRLRRGGAHEGWRARLDADQLTVTPVEGGCVLHCRPAGKLRLKRRRTTKLGPLAPGDGFSVGGLEFSLGAAWELPAQSETRAAGAESPSARSVWVVCGPERRRISEGEPLRIGQDLDNGLVLRDPCVSRQHAELRVEGDRCYLQDLGSTNGTWVNGLQVRQQELPVPCQIEVGRTQLHVEKQPPVLRPMIAGLVGRSAAMMEVVEHIHRFADAAEPILVQGASGTGKELVARALHEHSARSQFPFIAINCSALNANLVESELFGHTRGAFTGADEAKKGAFENAEGGTLFFDEIGELPSDLQPKLLRVLETGSVRRVGGVGELPVNVRVVAATHRDLREMVREGFFREDLYHRLYVINIQLPKLASRPEDILPLAEHFLRQRRGRPVHLDRSARHALLNHPWPGNIRELRNVLVRSLLLTDSNRLDRGDLQFDPEVDDFARETPIASLRERERDQKLAMMDALRAAGGNGAEAARLLNVRRSTFHDRLKRFRIPAGYGRGGP